MSRFLSAVTAIVFPYYMARIRSFSFIKSVILYSVIPKEPRHSEANNHIQESATSIYRITRHSFFNRTKLATAICATYVPYKQNLRKCVADLLLLDSTEYVASRVGQLMSYVLLTHTLFVRITKLSSLTHNS